MCTRLRAWASLEWGEAKDSPGCQDLQEVPGEGQKLLDMAVSPFLSQPLLLSTVSATAARLFSSSLLLTRNQQQASSKVECLSKSRFRMLIGETAPATAVTFVQACENLMPPHRASTSKTCPMATRQRSGFWLTTNEVQLCLFPLQSWPALWPLRQFYNTDLINCTAI